MVNVLLLDLLPKTRNLLPLFLRGFLGLLAKPLSNLVLSCLLLGSSSRFNLISVILHCFIVHLGILSYVVTDKRVGVCAVRIHLFDKLLRLLEEPRHYISFHHILLETICEVSHVPQIGKCVNLAILQE